ncbi:hypothetical protein [Leisingera sp. JC1]|uniref:hypothetical protein n=1 Tax=Leisingera sp. JC1 TaxID=1855282 RepID=UPI0008033241|nr:hypothetical protein [Leisingera sp. JC1]OBY25639.1 hypothetical protein A9D60_21195 [Leisingera sp. JC1]
MRFCSALKPGALAAAAFLAQGAALTAEETDQFQLDLNAVTETEAGDCRLTYVAANQSGTALERASYQIALFDGEGVVSRLLVLEFGALVEGKTKVLQFDLAGTPCGAISRIVVNDAPACTASDGSESPLCMSNLAASSRTPIQFGI